MKIDDSCAYFWDEVRRIAANEYVPNDKDILLVRYRTTGIIHTTFIYIYIYTILHANMRNNHNNRCN